MDYADIVIQIIKRTDCFDSPDDLGPTVTQTRYKLATGYSLSPHRPITETSPADPSVTACESDRRISSRFSVRNNEPMVQ